MKMNPLKALLRFLKAEHGSFRFGPPSHTDHVEDLRYETIADGKRNMREDLRRFGSDWKNIVNLNCNIDYDSPT